MKHGFNRDKIISHLKKNNGQILSHIAKATKIQLSSTHFTLNKYADFIRDNHLWKLKCNS